MKTIKCYYGEYTYTPITTGQQYFVRNIQIVIPEGCTYCGAVSRIISGDTTAISNIMPYGNGMIADFTKLAEYKIGVAFMYI